MSTRKTRSVSDHLAELPLFAACTKKELQAIAKLSTQRDVPAGKVLAREGAPGKEFVIVLDGTAVVDRGGRQIATLGPGEHFGEIALLDAHPRTASVTASTPMSIAVVGAGEFTELLEEVPSLAIKVTRGLARMIRQLRDDSDA
jgi:CRP-like cAMP-binding protein